MLRKEKKFWYLKNLTAAATQTRFLGGTLNQWAHLSEKGSNKKEMTASCYIYLFPVMLCLVSGIMDNFTDFKRVVNDFYLAHRGNQNKNNEVVMRRNQLNLQIGLYASERVKYLVSDARNTIVINVQKLIRNEIDENNVYAKRQARELHYARKMPITRRYLDRNIVSKSTDKKINKKTSPRNKKAAVQSARSHFQ